MMAQPSLNTTESYERVPQNRNTDKSHKGMCPQYMELRSLTRNSRNRMISHMAESAVFLAQRDPRKTAECRAQSPARTLMTGTAINFRKNTAEYNLAHTAEAHEKTSPPQIHSITKQKPAIYPRTEQETSKGYYWFL